LSEYAIDVRDVGKVYKGRGEHVHALRGVDMQIGCGEVFGLLGPNGAGKSTLIKILMTVIRSSGGTGTVLGEKIGHKPTLARIGYLPEHHAFPGYLTGGQLLDFYAALNKVPRSVRRQRCPELLELVGMADWSEKRVKGYSKGMRQRVGIAQALMNDPEIVLLDEPTDGVDPVGRRDIRRLVEHLKEQGRTVFLNSHLLSELEMVCDRVAILVQGKVKTQGSITDLTEPRTYYALEFRRVGGEPLAELEGDGGAALGFPVDRVSGLRLSDGGHGESGGGGGEGMIRRGEMDDGAWVRLSVAERSGGRVGRLEVGTTDPTRAQPFLDAARGAGLEVLGWRSVRPSLEDLFMEAVTDDLTGETLKPGAARDERSGA